MGGTQGFCLSGFADEISTDLNVQVSTLERLGVKGLDLRSVGGVNVLDLTITELQKVHDACAERGLHVQAIGSPVNKVAFEPLNEAREFDKLRRAIKAAHRVNVKRIRIFTPMVPEGQNEAAGPKVIAWMLAQNFECGLESLGAVFARIGQKPRSLTDEDPFFDLSRRHGLQLLPAIAGGGMRDFF